MSTIHLHQTTTATPEQFVAGLTDFGPGRSKVFPNSADSDLEVVVGAVGEQLRAAGAEVGEPGDELLRRSRGRPVDVKRGHALSMCATRPAPSYLRRGPSVLSTVF